MPYDVVFMFDFFGVLTTSPFPTLRHVAKRLIREVVDEASEVHLRPICKNTSPEILAQQYSNFYMHVNDFSRKYVGGKSAVEALQIGDIGRAEFLDVFNNEIRLFMDALVAKTPEDVRKLKLRTTRGLGSLQHRFPMLLDDVVQELVREMLTAETFLSVIEKVSMRKNVANMLYYIKSKAGPHFRVAIVANNWEIEGQYLSKVHKCPIEFQDSGITETGFNVRELFDAVSESHTLHQRKPHPDLFFSAINAIEERRQADAAAAAAKGDKEALSNAEIRPEMFYFDDTQSNCEAASKLPGHPYTETYQIRNGSNDVFRYALEALQMIAREDDFWDVIVKGLQSFIKPLFPTPMGPDGRPMSWVRDEIMNHSRNALFMPHSPSTSFRPLAAEHPRYLSLDERDRILFFLGKNAPHMFPVDVPADYQPNLNLAERPSLATSSGPIRFDYYQSQSDMTVNRTYLLTLRTGSFVLRMQPKGVMGGSSNNSVQLEYDMLSHFNDHATDVPVPAVLLYCDDPSVAGGSHFFVMRYVSGIIPRTVEQLVHARIPRTLFGERLRIPKTAAPHLLNPRLFVTEALRVLVRFHSAPIPSFWKKRREVRLSAYQTHPVLQMVQNAEDLYRQVMSSVGVRLAYLVESISFVVLTEAVKVQFNIPISQRKANPMLGKSHASVPMPERRCLVHGDYSLNNMSFTHRSMEGNPNALPRIHSLFDFEQCHYGDPLIDVANFTVHLHFAPHGLKNQKPEYIALFPSPMEILEEYCSLTSLMQGIPPGTRRHIFNVYMASICQEMASKMLTKIAETAMEHKPGEEPNPRLVELKDYMDEMGEVGEALLGLGGTGQQFNAKL